MPNYIFATIGKKNDVSLENALAGNRILPFKELSIILQFGEASSLRDYNQVDIMDRSQF